MTRTQFGEAVRWVRSACPALSRLECCQLVQSALDRRPALDVVTKAIELARAGK